MKLPVKAVGEVVGMAAGDDPVAALREIGKAVSEVAVTTREIARIQAMREVALAEINRRYDFYHDLFEKVFSERRDAVNRVFDEIQAARERGDSAMAVKGLETLGQIVASSPFQNLKELQALVNSRQVIEL